MHRLLLKIAATSPAHLQLFRYLRVHSVKITSFHVDSHRNTRTEAWGRHHDHSRRMKLGDPRIVQFRGDHNSEKKAHFNPGHF